MTQEIKEQALAAFLKNPYWKGIYDKAPAKAKIFYEIVFANSEGLIPKEEHVSSIHEIYRQFDDADWEYIIANTRNKMAKWGYNKAREKFGKKNQD